MVNMVFIRLERTSVLLEAGQAYANRVEEGDSEHADCHGGSSRHVVYLRHNMKGVLFAETEDEGRNEIAQEETAGISHEDLAVFPEDVIDEEDRQCANHTDSEDRPAG